MLIGFDFSVDYRLGRLNMVVDALSCHDAKSTDLAMLSGPSFQLYEDIRQEVERLPEMIKVHQRIISGELSTPWQLQDGLILHSNRVFLDCSSTLLQTVLELTHTAVHEGVQKTLQRLRVDFFIELGRSAVWDFIQSLPHLQRNKTETLYPAGLLQPLPECQCHHKCGQTSHLISLRVSLRSMESQ